jgi:succinate-semialdehyde dehydrogenase
MVETAQNSLIKFPANETPVFEANSLLLELSYFAGRWQGSSSGKVIEVTNPSDGMRIGCVPELEATDVEVAVKAASGAFKSWRGLLPRERGNILTRWHDLIVANIEQLAALMTLEQGKPLDDARAEITYAASFIIWFSEEGNRLYGDVIPSHLPDTKMIVQHQPVGVVAAITPWNFPTAMLTRKAAAALAAGCTVLAVPSRITPYSALALAKLGELAGIPEGVFSVLTGQTRNLVAQLCTDPNVRALSYTGSTAVGRKIMAQCAGTVKRVSLELGGHAPFIVFSDADIDKAVADAVAAKFQTGGQDCLAANRIFLAQEIYEEFLEKFTRATELLVVGDGFDEAVQIGPLATPDTLSKSLDHVTDALAKGARLHTGGGPHRLGGLFFEPTIISEVTPKMKIFYEETFGPVAAIIPFDEETAVITQANDTEYGLVAYVYTENFSRALRVSNALEYGMVAINTPKLTGAPIPFGGVKQSGIGREGSRLGIHEYTEFQYICMAL